MTKNLPALREAFREGPAKAMAARLGGFVPADETWSRRFAYFTSDDALLVAAGRQECNDIQRALAIGMLQRRDRKLVLLLPTEYRHATLQRTPWLRADACPEVYTYDADHFIEGCQTRSRDEAIERVRSGPANGDPESELLQATRPHHLDAFGGALSEVVDWATAADYLDASHRPGERSWAYMGQKVLSIKATNKQCTVRAGIHFTIGPRVPTPIVIAKGAASAEVPIAAIRATVIQAVQERKSGNGEIGRPDEHWLQAYIRRSPNRVGVEQPALREVPAWRPTYQPDKSGVLRHWGRGFIDLLGLDGYGDIRLVETKVESNKDEMFVLQGLDYYVWALAYRDVLATRLGAPKEAEFKIHYVVGASATGHGSVHPATDALLESLAPDINWGRQVVPNWYAPDAQVIT